MHLTTPYTRRTFVKRGLIMAASACAWLDIPGIAADKRKRVMTVLGAIDASDMGNTLAHEHILVDFIGAEEVNPPRWDRDDVIKKVLPHLDEAKNAGCHTLIDCTPNYLGRDVGLLKILAERTGMHILTNTGYYGGSDHKFLPAHALKESSDQLADRWIEEWRNGIDGTFVRPGFIKISVNAGHLSDVSLKLIHAAGHTHLKTGLPIASHTGPAIAAFQQIEVLKASKIDPSAFIWVHAQSEHDQDQYISAAREGAWVSLDGLRQGNVDDYVNMLLHVKRAKCLHRVLVSHDAGWYDPSKTDGGEFRPYTVLFRQLIPALEQEGFLESEILQLIRSNPANAFAIGVRKLKRKRKLEKGGGR